MVRNGLIKLGACEQLEVVGDYFILLLNILSETVIDIVSEVGVSLHGFEDFDLQLLVLCDGGHGVVSMSVLVFQGVCGFFQEVLFVWVQVFDFLILVHNILKIH